MRASLSKVTSPGIDRTWVGWKYCFISSTGKQSDFPNCSAVKNLGIFWLLKSEGKCATQRADDNGTISQLPPGTPCGTDDYTKQEISFLLIMPKIIIIMVIIVMAMMMRMAMMMMMIILMKVLLMIMPELPLRNPKPVSTNISLNTLYSNVQTASQKLNDRVNFMIYYKCESLACGHRNSSISELLDSENPTPRICFSSSSFSSCSVTEKSPMLWC